MVKIDFNTPCFIIAEAGVNHNGNLQMAYQLIDVACEAKADAVKFQTFKAEKLITKNAPKAAYQKQTTPEAESQFGMLKKLEFSKKDHQKLKEYCFKKGILFMSTPFDEESADLLDAMGMPLFKIPSGELTNFPFLAHIAKKRKLMIVSTGMATLEEVHQAVQTIRKAGNNQLILLHCVSHYPTDPQEVNLLAMETMRKEFRVPVGFSDHTLGIEISLAATALGAKVVEKHFTLDRGLPGPDHKASLEPLELKALVEGIRKVEKSLGNGRKGPTESEVEIAKVARKSLVAAKNIPVGSKIKKDWVAIRRPGTGLEPKMLSKIIGSVAKRNIQEGETLKWEMFQR